MNLISTDFRVRGRFLAVLILIENKNAFDIEYYKFYFRLKLSPLPRSRVWLRIIHKNNIIPT